MHFITRGILLGGAVGVFGYLAGFSGSLGRAFGLGMIAGALAGYTLMRRRAGKSPQKDA